jgi:HlyD family secretion protein
MTALPAPPAAAPRTDLRGPARASLWASLLLVGVLGGWAALTPITGAVIAHGQAVVLGEPRPVQSLDGGAVATVLVAEGDSVTAGQPVLQMDRVLLSTNLDIARSRLAEALALRARLMAEQQDQPLLEAAPPALPFALPDMTAALAGQQAILTTRRDLRTGEEARAQAAMAEIDAQRAGTEGQIAALTTQIALLTAERTNLQALANQGLVRDSQITETDSRLAALQGEAARLTAEIARLTTARGDADLARIQTRQAVQEDTATALREATATIEELTLEIISRSAALDRAEIRAPVAGVVHDLAVTTPGEVLAPGATAMQIVPLADGVEFALRIDPRAIDQVTPGQTAELMLSAFDPQSTPKLRATVISVPPDAETDPQTGATFYRVTLRLADGELARLNGQTIRPGMPVEAYLATRSHSVLAYLLDPVQAHLNRAFRE